LGLDNKTFVRPFAHSWELTKIFNPQIVDLVLRGRYLLDNGIYSRESIESHLESIRNQMITQIFYLPKGQKIEHESIVFLDRLNNCNNEIIDRERLQDIRLFTLSQYGHYLFVFKLSIHFTRIMEGVER